MGERQVTLKRIATRTRLPKAITLAVITSILVGLTAGAAAAAPPSCDVSVTTIDFLSENCTGTNCTWSYNVCQTGFALSHWVLGRCPCFGSHITEVGYIDAQDNRVILPKCSEGQTTPCWEFGLDPTTGLFGLKWDNLPGPENECWTFYFTIDQDVDETEVKWTSKFAACAPGSGNVTGPACSCGCGEILAFKYYDVNKNGVYDEGDYELEGWEICLNSTCNVTDEMGFVDFGCLAPGTYEVCENLTGNWTNSQPGGGQLCYTVNITAGQQVKLHFGNYEDDPEVAYVRAGKYYDYNQNGVCDDPSCPLNQWEICLDGNCTTTRDICMLCGGCTDYWEVEPGSHNLCETLQIGWVNTDPGVAPPCKQVTVANGTYLCVPFGNWEPGPPVGGEAHLVSKASVLAPWAASAALLAGGAAWYALRRRRVRS
jgi:hypothetical protein